MEPFIPTCHSAVAFNISASITQLDASAQTAAPRESELERAELAAVRSLLGLARGGAAACTALALLAGGDYDLGGADAVGRVGALRVVRHLLVGREDDVVVLARLRALVAAGADPSVMDLVKCTGVLSPPLSLGGCARFTVPVLMGLA